MRQDKPSQAKLSQAYRWWACLLVVLVLLVRTAYCEQIVVWRHPYLRDLDAVGRSRCKTPLEQSPVPPGTSASPNPGSLPTAWAV